MIRITNYILFFFIIISSCKEKESTVSINNLLTNRSSKTWVLKSVAVNSKETLTEDCKKDNEWTFTDAGTVLKTPGFLRCQLYEKDTTATYFLGGPNNESIYFTVLDSIHMYYPTDTTYYLYKVKKTDIISISEEVLQYKSETYSPYGNYVSSAVYTFSAKEK